MNWTLSDEPDAGFQSTFTPKASKPGAAHLALHQRVLG